MKKTFLAFYIVMILLVLFTPIVSAEIRAKTFSVTPFIGGYTFEGNEDLKTRPVVGLRLGYDFTRNWGMEGAFDYVKTTFSRNNSDSDVYVWGYRLEALYNFMPGGRLVPFVAAGLGGRSADYRDPSSASNHFLGDYGAGVRYFLTDNLALRGDIRHLILTNDTYSNLEYTLGLTYYFAKAKPAREVAVKQAEPPPPPPPAPPLPAPLNLKATPASVSKINLGWDRVADASGYKIYRDGSYLMDSKTAAVPDQGLNADTRYCYKVTAVDDTGKESVVSNQSCAKTLAPPPPPPPPALPAPLNLTAKPASESEIDLDWNTVGEASSYKVYRDGSYVAASRMPMLPDKGLQADTRYCYQVTAIDDTGRESVQSNQACAKTPPPPVMMEEKKVAAVEKEMIEKGRAIINIEFDTGKANIKPKYHDEIKKFADVMKKYPDLKVVIEGHTDNVGGAAFNQKLSERRANSVRSYMIKTFGIQESRLSAKGYGFSKPFDSNKTAKGRQKNRRVEAVVDYVIKK